MIVVSHLSQHAPASLTNHRQYARLHGYRHELIDASCMPQTLPLRALYRYECLLNKLTSLPEGALLLLLSEDAAIIDPVPLERLMQERDMLLVRLSDNPLPQIDVQFWRNTSAMRQTVRQLIKKCKLSGPETLNVEATLFAGLETESYTTFIQGICPVLPGSPRYDPAWSRIPTFAISIDVFPEFPEQKYIPSRFRDILVTHINNARAASLPMLSFPQYAQDSDMQVSERSTYNPGQKIAIITLYTKNVEIYARISEQNLRRYCEQHGYTLYVHRDIPAEIGINGTGNWFKPWLLHGYMQHHEWVIWLDADILINNFQQAFEPLLEGRDWLIAQDIGQWLFNSGMMGFRRTPQNDEMLRRIMASIAALPDRSDVYAVDGDQPRFIEAMEATYELTSSDFLDFISFNTPWMFRRPDSFIVHYYGMWPSIRALIMAHDAQLLW